MRIDKFTVLYAVSPDGLAAVHLDGIANMINGGFDLENVVIFTDKQEADDAFLLQKVRRQIEVELKNLNKDQLEAVRNKIKVQRSIKVGNDS